MDGNGNLFFVARKKKRLMASLPTKRRKGRGEIKKTIPPGD